MMKQVTDITDESIINLLDMDFHTKYENAKMNGLGVEQISNLLPQAMPNNCLTLSPSQEREFAASLVYSPYCPRKIIRDRIEVLFNSSFYDDYSANWICIEKVNKKFNIKDDQFKPAVAPPFANYLFHHKQFDSSIQDHSTIPFTIKDGRMIPALSKSNVHSRGMGFVVNDKTWETVEQSICIAINIAEEFIRVDSFNVALENTSTNHTITLNVPTERLAELLYIRDNPLTTTGRKRPIIHWVSSHFRNTKYKTDIKINKHLRGITRFKLDGFNVEVRPNTSEEAKKFLH